MNTITFKIEVKEAYAEVVEENIMKLPIIRFNRVD